MGRVPASLLIVALLITFPATARGDAVINNLVVINADPTIIQPGEPFDLQGATVVFTPNLGGGYSVSTIPAAFDARVGNPTGIGVGGSVQPSLGFAFPFFNRTWTSLFVNANGTLTFTAPDGGPHFNAGGRARRLAQPSALCSTRSGSFLESLPCGKAGTPSRAEVS